MRRTKYIVWNMEFYNDCNISYSYIRKHIPGASYTQGGVYQVGYKVVFEFVFDHYTCLS